VFVTIEASTITLHDAPTSTVYVPDGQGPPASAESVHPTPAFTDVNSNSPVSAEPSLADGVVTIINTVFVTAAYTAQTPTATEVLSYYVSGTSTIYLNGPPPAASESIVYAGSATLTIEPVQASTTELNSPTPAASELTVHSGSETSTIHLNGPPPAASESVVHAGSETLTIEPIQSAPIDPKTTTISGKTTIRVTQQVTVTGTLSAQESSTLGTNPSFTGIGSGGWNGTEGGTYPTGTDVTGVSPTGMVTKLTSFPVAASTASTSSLAAQDGFGASDSGSLSTADPTFDFTKTFSPVSLSTMAAQSGFNAFSSASYANGTSASSISAPSTTSVSDLNGASTTVQEISAPSVTQSACKFRHCSQTFVCSSLIQSCLFKHSIYHILT
jgi:hypothetical protein